MGRAPLSQAVQRSMRESDWHKNPTRQHNTEINSTNRGEVKERQIWITGLHAPTVNVELQFLDNNNQ